jgi:ABC-type multidrug transport system fused ATPase/permease subunit
MGSLAQTASNLETSLSAVGRLMQLADLPSESEVVRRLPPPSHGGAAVASRGSSSAHSSSAGSEARPATDTPGQEQRPDLAKALGHSAATSCLGMIGSHLGMKGPSTATQKPWLPSDDTAWARGGTVITFHAVTAAYSWAAPAPALRSLSLTVPAGSTCALVGRSGSGKSTAVLALTGQIPILAGERVGTCSLHPAAPRAAASLHFGRRYHRLVH